MSAASFQLYVMLRSPTKTHDGGDVSIQRLETTQDVVTDILDRFTSIHQSWRDSYEMIEYTPSYRTEQNEVFFIDNFILPAKITDTLTKRQHYPEFSVASAKQHGLVVKAFLGVYKRADGTVAYYFQIIDQRHLLDQGSKWYPIVFLNSKYSRLTEEALTIGDHLSIISDSRDKRLSFRSFRDASLLLDLTIAFKDATDADIKTILGCNKVKNTPAEIQKIIDLCDNTMRKKFAIIQYDGTLDNVNVKAAQIADKAKEFDIEVKVSGKGDKAKIVFPQEREMLKRFLRFLCQDFYESILTGDKCISNSHRKIT